MTRPAPPEHLVTLVPADVALHLLGRAGLADYRRKHRGENGRVDDVLLAMSKAAYRWCEMADKGRNRAPTTDSGTELLTTGQVAERAGVSTRTVRRAIENGMLPTYRAGRIHLITPADAADWTRRNRQ